MSVHPIRKLKHATAVVARKKPFEPSDGSYVGLEHIQPWTGEIETELASTPEGTVSLFEAGDILFGKLRPYLAKVALATFSGACSTEALVLRARCDMWPPYLRYVLVERGFIDRVSASTFGAQMPRASWEFIGSLPIPTPDLPTQKTIADFLNRETARIDHLIEKKERLVGLLNEKQVAAVSSLVAGVMLSEKELVARRSRFLPFVPRYWQLKRLKFGISKIEQGWSPECEARLAEDGEWGVLKVGCVNYGRFRDSEHKALPKELSPRPSLEIRTGDLLVSRANTPELVGSVALVDQTRPNLMLCDKLYRISVDERTALSEFLHFALNDRYVRRQIESECSGASQSMQNLSQAFVREIEIAFPPLDEQAQIVVECRNISHSVEVLIASIESSVERLRELRSTLITAAVTGQIDVTTWGKRGETDRRLEAIEHELEAAREEVAV